MSGAQPAVNQPEVACRRAHRSRRGGPLVVLVGALLTAIAPPSAATPALHEKGILGETGHGNGMPGPASRSGMESGPRAAQERSLAITRFEADIRVDTSSVIDVTERITARFTGSWNGLYRAIPLKYRTAAGFNWTLGFDLVSVTGDDGQPLRVERSRERHYVKLKIWIPGAENATRTVLLRYRARNGLRFFDEHDELYWNVTGDEWDVPIESAAAVIRLPAGAAGVRAVAFNGVYGATAQDASVRVDGSTVNVTMPGSLGFREGLTAVVGWNKGVVAEPTGADRAAEFGRSNWPVLLPVPVFLLMYRTWRRRGRDPDRLPITVQYEPPAKITPAEAGTLFDNKVDMRDVTATMVDLAVRGYLRFEERDDRALLGLIRRREYLLHRVKPESDWSALQPHERLVLAGLFADGISPVELSSLENEFYRSLPPIHGAVFNALLDHGFYRARPDKVQGWWVSAGVVLGLVVGGAGAAWANQLALSPVAFIVAGILTAAIVAGFGLVMPARTVAGARALEQLLGFEEFLRRVESHHRERIVNRPELFDAYLPFAMAFGVEGKWARAFEDIYREPPTWYVGPSFGRFTTGGLSSRLADFSTRAGSALSSSPRSSSGSGFSGGSSGGGGGGGGGGGF